MPHPLSLVTITLGILFTLRKLDVGHRLPSNHPGVSLADFELWKATAMRAYGFGVWSCFLKLVADFAGRYLMQSFPPSVAMARTIGISIDVLWAGSIVLTFLKVRSSHRLAERLGIEARRPVNDGDPEVPLKSSSEGSPPPPAA